MAGSETREAMWARFLNENLCRKVAEVGVWKGELAKHLLAACPSIESYTMIDSWRHLDGWNKPFNLTDAQFDEIYHHALQNTEFARAKTRILRGTTLEVRSEIEDQSLDFIYIDGDHSLRGIVIDALTMWEKLRVGGVMAGDDFSETVWQHSEQFEPTLVNPFMRYFADAVGEELHILPHGQYFLRKSVSHGQGAASAQSAHHGLLPLIKLAAEPSVSRGQSAQHSYTGSAKRVAKAVLRRISSRYRERELVRRHREAFPTHFSKTGIVFIHVPKAAGTSINLALYGKGGQHVSLAEYWYKFPHSMKKMRTCAVFRDPVERFCSAFHYLKSGGINEIDAKFAATHLARFDNPSQLASSLISGVEQHSILRFMHFRPQVSWICAPLVGRVVDCLVSIKELDLLRDWLQVATQANIHLTEANVTVGASKRSASLSAEANEVLKQIYRHDFEVCELLARAPGMLVPGASKKAKAMLELQRILLG